MLRTEEAGTVVGSLQSMALCLALGTVHVHGYSKPRAVHNSMRGRTFQLNIYLRNCTI